MAFEHGSSEPLALIVSPTAQSRLKPYGKPTFRLHHIPLWFRQHLTAAAKRHGWDISGGSLSGWQAFQTLKSSIGLVPFDHFGSMGARFVVRLHSSIDEASELAVRIGNLLELDSQVSVEPAALWVSWSELPTVE